MKRGIGTMSWNVQREKRDIQVIWIGTKIYRARRKWITLWRRAIIVETSPWTMLMELPEELIVQVSNCLPLLDRVSLACTSKPLLEMSRRNLVEIMVDICNPLEAQSLSHWLAIIAKYSPLSLQRFEIAIPSCLGEGLSSSHLGKFLSDYFRSELHKTLLHGSCIDRSMSWPCDVNYGLPCLFGPFLHMQ